jgi:non-canonical poly(A) RNA polymerase PAPD5/7
VRHTLVERVSTALSSRRWFTQDSGRILCFGSYPAGLYLPTGDMDLVYASDSHYKGGPPLLVSTANQNPFKRMLYKAARRLEDAHVAAGRVTVIGNAKVPILKFQDRLTGLAVDISFENLSGVQAQATFQEWKEQHPDMVYLVPLVKQFLVMRGLNEVHTGGLGGFSVICLIVNYLHHAPQATNLGDRFMGFLEFYGKKFDMATQRLQMHPIEIVNKVSDERSSSLYIAPMTIRG